jgi:hypothetical protein
MYRSNRWFTVDPLAATGARETPAAGSCWQRIGSTSECYFINRSCSESSLSFGKAR